MTVEVCYLISPELTMDFESGILEEPKKTFEFPCIATLLLIKLLFSEFLKELGPRKDCVLL